MWLEWELTYILPEVGGGTCASFSFPASSVASCAYALIELLICGDCGGWGLEGSESYFSANVASVCPFAWDILLRMVDLGGSFKES